jgi:hypothetical protein
MKNEWSSYYNELFRDICMPCVNLKIFEEAAFEVSDVRNVLVLKEI